MDRDSVDRLRFDRRLEQRSGWVEDRAREENLKSLPDVTDKMTVGLDEEDETPTPIEGEAPSTDVGSTQVGFSAPTPPATPTPQSPAPSYPRTSNEGSFGGGGGGGGGSELS